MKKTITLLLLFTAMFAFVQQAYALTYSVTVPTGTKACYIAGDMNSWSTSATPMTKVDETHYTIDLPNATETQGYKYLSGPDWTYVEKDAQGKELAANRTWTANDVVATWALTFVPDERDITIEVLVPKEVLVLYIVGAFNGWASPSEATKMTFVSEDIDGKIFTKTVHSNDAYNMEFHFCAGPAWAYEQSDPKGNFKFGTTENSTAVVANAFKAYFDPAKTGTINITATVPAGTSNVWIMGDFLGWNWDNIVEGVKNTDGTFSFSIPLVMSIEYRLYNNPDWDHPEVGEADPSKDLPNRSAVYPADANKAITVWGWKTPISGINNPKMDNNVYSSNGILTIEGVNAQVEVFDISGRLLQQAKLTGTFNSEKLNRGLYILRVDGKTAKTMVQ